MNRSGCISVFFSGFEVSSIVMNLVTLDAGASTVKEEFRKECFFLQMSLLLMLLNTKILMSVKLWPDQVVVTRILLDLLQTSPSRS
jgi:hypothetical protein